MHTLTSREVGKDHSTERRTTLASRRPSLELYPPSDREKTVEVIDNRLNRSYHYRTIHERHSPVKQRKEDLSVEEEQWLASVEALKVESNQTALHAMNEYRTLLGHLERKEMSSSSLEAIKRRLELRLR